MKVGLEVAAEFIVAEGQLPGFFADIETVSLIGRALVSDPVVHEDEFVGFSEDTDPVALLITPVVQDVIPVEQVPVTGHRFGLVAEQDTLSSVATRPVVLEGVIRVLVTDGDSRYAVIQQLVVFEGAVFNAPA
jgi:hypothetical protein